jgi:DNA-binding FadR family transcriptional regulator
VERKLAARFGARLTAIREALIALESEVVIIKKPNSSTFTMNLTFEDPEKIFRIRRVLEAYAFEEAPRRAGRDDQGTFDLLDDPKRTCRCRRPSSRAMRPLSGHNSDDGRVARGSSGFRTGGET